VKSIYSTPFRIGVKVFSPESTMFVGRDRRETGVSRLYDGSPLLQTFSPFRASAKAPVKYYFVHIRAIACCTLSFTADLSVE